MAKPSTSERALKRLQGLVRRPRPAADVDTAHSGRVPNDLATEEVRWIYLLPDEKAAWLDAEDALLADERFEHLVRSVDRAVWRFICKCHVDRSTNHVPAFLEEYAREPQEHTLYIPVESLKVEEPLAVANLSLLPLSDPVVESGKLGVPIDPPIAAVAAVPVTGTDAGRMIARGRGQAARGLRVLRVGLREHREINDRQLRFRLSHTHSFGEGAGGFQIHPDQAWELPLTAHDAALAESQPLAQLAQSAKTRLERRAELALEWIERAFLATDRTVELLYLFFALEALLGDKDEGLKGHSLAFRRAMLSVATRGSFSDPGRVYYLYDEVRSAAVHGERAPEVGRSTHQSFRWGVRRALNEYLEFAAANGITKRAALLRALNEHEDAPRLAEWLRKYGDDSWVEYLDKLALDAPSVSSAVDGKSTGTPT